MAGAPSCPEPRRRHHVRPLTDPGRRVAYTPLPDDDGIYRRIVPTATGKDGGTNLVVIRDIAMSTAVPTASLANSGPVNEGSAGFVRFTSQFDPSPADTSAGFSYGYDFDNDGTFEVTGSRDPSATVPAAYLDDGPGTRTVPARIADEDGGWNDYIAVIQVPNVAPTASVSGPIDGVCGQERRVALAATDPSGTDTAAGFTFRVAWGGGSARDVFPGRPLSVGRVYTGEGPNPISVTARG